MHTPNPMVRTQGFTLLELMTAVTVLAVLLGIGVPAFSGIMRDNQISSESNNLMAAITLARSEAMKRGVRVSVCPSATEDACDPDGNWDAGWIVFADDFGTAGVFDTSDETLQVFGAPGNGVNINTEATSVTFSRSGRAEFREIFQVTKNGCTDNQMRRIEVDLSGRTGLRRVDCATALE